MEPKLIAPYHGGELFPYLLVIEEETPGYAVTLGAAEYSNEPGKPVEIPVTIVRRAGYEGDIEIRASGVPESFGEIVATSTAAGKSAKKVTLRIAAPATDWRPRSSRPSRSSRENRSKPTPSSQ